MRCTGKGTNRVRSECTSGAGYRAEPDAASDLPQRQIAFLPEQLLQPGEIIILYIKPSAWYILLEPIMTLVAIVAATWGVSWLAGQEWLWLAKRDVILFGLVLIGLRVGWQFLEWLSRVYVLTDARVLRVMGVLRVQVFEAPLKQIQHTDTVFSLRERFLGLGSIAFSTAGTGSIDAVWRMVAQPLDVHQRVVHALNRYR